MKDRSDTANLYPKLTPTKARILFLASVCVIFILTYFLNILFPLYSDDLLYSFIYDSQPLTKITSFGDIFQSQLNHYLYWGGRTVVHTIAQFLLWFGTGWADLLNSLMFVAYLYVIYRFSNKRRKISVYLFLFLTFILWLVLPTPTATVLWITGSANYLWGTLIVLLFLYPYYSYYISGECRKGLIWCVLFFVAGVIAGWTNENIFIAQIFFIFSLFFLFRKKHLKIPLWAITGLIGACIGGALMLLAPGNFIRTEIINETLGLADMSVIDNVLYRVGKALYRYQIYVLPLVLVYLAALYLYIKHTNKDQPDKDILRGSLLFFASAHVAWGVMVASPLFPSRAMFSMVTLVVVALGILCANMKLQTKVFQKLKMLTFGILFLVFSVNYIIDCQCLSELSLISKQREDYLYKEKNRGNKDITFNREIILPGKYQYEDLSTDVNRGVNRVYANYYGLDSVRIAINAELVR